MFLTIVCCGTALLGVSPTSDTTLTLQGVVAVSGETPGGAGRAVMVLTEPILIGSTQMWILPLGGDAARWRNWDSRYIEARGELGSQPPQGIRFTPVQIRDVEPDSGSSGEVVSPSHHSNVRLAVLPHRFTAVSGDSTGGITPLIYYKITVQGQTNLTFEFSNNEFICVSVRA